MDGDKWQSAAPPPFSHSLLQAASCPPPSHPSLSWFCLKTHFSSDGKTIQKCQRRLFCTSPFGHFCQSVSLSLSPLCHFIPLYDNSALPLSLRPTMRPSVSSLLLVIGACSLQVSTAFRVGECICICFARCSCIRICQVALFDRNYSCGIRSCYDRNLCHAGREAHAARKPNSEFRIRFRIPKYEILVPTCSHSL